MNENMKNEKLPIKTQRKLLKIQKLLNLFFLLVFFLTITIFGILFFVLPKKEISEIEQRKLAKFPEFSVTSLWSGGFTSGLNIYYSDNFVFREQLVKAKFAIEENKGLRLNDVKIYGENGESTNSSENISEIYKENITSLLECKNITPDIPVSPIDLNNPYYTDPNKTFDIYEKLNEGFGDYLGMDKNELTGEKRGSLFVIGDTALEIFYGNDKVALDYARVLNTYAEAISPSVNIYNMLVPTHFEFGLPKKYKGKVGRPQYQFFEKIRDNLDNRIIFVDSFGKMKHHYLLGEYLYFRTDHHWTGLGAYRAYEKFCEYAALTPLSLDKYEKRTTTGFLGTLYNSSLDKNLKANPDKVEYFVTDLPYEQTNYRPDGSTYKGKLFSEPASGRTNGYITFMSGDIPLAEIKTSNTNGKKILVFKESYGNAFCPYLIPHYETVYVADIRTFPYNPIKFINENGVTDVLFLNNIMAANSAARVANILQLLQK